MDKKEATAKIASLLAEAEAKLDEARTVADENDVSFHWDGPNYGMGGYYSPKPQPPEGLTTEEREEWEESNWSYSDDYGWRSSSQSC